MRTGSAPMLTWTCLHLYAGSDGVSVVNPAFTTELSAVDFAPPAPPLLVANASGAKGLAFVEVPVGWRGGWHPSPKKQWVICLAGEMGYRAGDGTEFALRPGSCILTTDTTGQGHDSWNAGADPVRLAIIPLEQ